MKKKLPTKVVKMEIGPSSSAWDTYKIVDTDEKAEYLICPKCKEMIRGTSKEVDGLSKPMIEYYCEKCRIHWGILF